MEHKQFNHLKITFESELFENVIPFWEKHSPDWNHGGYYNCLDRNGEVYDTRKHIWLQGRQVWMFSKLYNTVEPNDRWLNIAELGINFLREHAPQKDGRLYFSVDEQGQPLWQQRKIFTECFYIIALAEYSRATGRPDLMDEAKEELEKVWEWSKDLTTVGRPSFKGNPSTSSLAIPMILLNVIEEITGNKTETYSREIEECVRQILLHIDEERQLVYETVKKDGSYLDTIEGRLLNPGHAIEAGWFLQHWAQRLNRRDLQDKAIKMTRWSFDKGWDGEFGGIYYFLDARGYSPTQLEWFMKLWWPHTEAMYAFLLNYSITESQQDWDRFKKVKNYAFSHFKDPEHKEWYGYLDREGNVTHRFKGGPYKGFFHVPRSLWLCIKLLDGWGK